MWITSSYILVYEKRAGFSSESSCKHVSSLFEPDCFSSMLAHLAQTLSFLEPGLSHMGRGGFLPHSSASLPVLSHTFSGVHTPPLIITFHCRTYLLVGTSGLVSVVPTTEKCARLYCCLRYSCKGCKTNMLYHIQPFRGSI